MDLHASNEIKGNWLSLSSGLVAPFKLFRIDHPLDPANMFLFHACVESDRPTNVYNGVVKLNRAGTAVVKLPRWFEALNTDVSFQLSCIGNALPFT